MLETVNIMRYGYLSTHIPSFYLHICFYPSIQVPHGRLGRIRESSICPLLVWIFAVIGGSMKMAEWAKEREKAETEENTRGMVIILCVLLIFISFCLINTPLIRTHKQHWCRNLALLKVDHSDLFHYRFSRNSSIFS